MPKVNAWWIVIIGVIALLALLFSTGAADDFTDNLGWVDPIQKLNDSGDIYQNIGLPGGGYIEFNGTHLIVGNT